MNINYILLPNGNKLFSFFVHDYNSCETGEVIDGGFEYTRYNGNLQKGKIDDLIGDIREQFVWGKNYDKDNNLLPKTQFIKLKDLDTDHIINILRYFTKESTNSNTWRSIHYIFLTELYYRENYKIQS